MNKNIHECILNYKRPVRDTSLSFDHEDMCVAHPFHLITKGLCVTHSFLSFNRINGSTLSVAAGKPKHSF